MVEKILQLLSVTCRHKKISQPFTASWTSPGRLGQSSASWESVRTPASHYVVCLDCGKKFTYDWDKMRIVR
jgi:hypothetical protein